MRLHPLCLIPERAATLAPSRQRTSSLRTPGRAPPATSRRCSVQAQRNFLKLRRRLARQQAPLLETSHKPTLSASQFTAVLAAAFALATKTRVLTSYPTNRGPTTVFLVSSARNM